MWVNCTASTWFSRDFFSSSLAFLGIYQLSNFPWYLFGTGSQIMSTLAALIPVIIGIGLIVIVASSVKHVPPQVPQSVVVREIVTVKIGCSYCGTLFDETVDECPNCGAKR